MKSPRNFRQGATPPGWFGKGNHTWKIRNRPPTPTREQTYQVHKQQVRFLSSNLEVKLNRLSAGWPGGLRRGCHKWQQRRSY